MKLREELHFNNSSLKFDGFVDMGDLTPSTQTNKVANQALVFMFVPFLNNWVQPVAIYASRNGTPADILEKMLVQVILQLEAAGARVIVFTCDGSQINKKTWKSLGISTQLSFILNHIFTNPPNTQGFITFETLQ